MSINASTPKATSMATQQSNKYTRVPAPIQGIDSRTAISNNNPNVCVYTYNLIPSEYGMQLRKGYREWQIDIETAPGLGLGVSTIIPFEGNTEGPADDRLFAVTNEGIWDVTINGALPVLKTSNLEWQISSSDAGWGTYCHYLDDADNEFLFYADSINGLFQYTKSTDTWALATGITGVDVTLINFVVVHKQRIWFGVQNSTIGHYLPIGAKQGAVTDFNFGGKFKHGGGLVGLYNWTVDGGDGVDDYLVAISSSGDVLPYRGSDPSQADWNLVGTYFVGALASGGRCCSQDGGNMNILSTYGITAMSDLLRGVDPRLPNQDSIAASIAPFIRADMGLYRNNFGWDIKTITSEGSLILVTPERLDGTYLQYVHNFAVGGWGIWRDIPLRCMDVWETFTRVGTKDNRVLVMDVSKDDIKITPPEDAPNGVNIQFSILMNYNDMGEPSLFKRGSIARPDFSTRSSLNYEAKFLYDYDISEILTTPQNNVDTSNNWDFGLWDKAIWASSTVFNQNQINGGSGIGRYISVAIKGNALGSSTLLSCDVFWNTGGAL